MTNTWDLVHYAETLAAGDALTVKRLAQKADFDATLLEDAVHAAHDRVVQYQGWSDRAPWRRWNGIHKALVKALADAEALEYRKRSRRSA